MSGRAVFGFEIGFCRDAAVDKAVVGGVGQGLSSCSSVMQLFDLAVMTALLASRRATTGFSFVIGSGIVNLPEKFGVRKNGFQKIMGNDFCQDVFPGYQTAKSIAFFIRREQTKSLRV